MIGLVVYLLGVPLAIPLAVLVFLGAFIPFIGALVAGGLAVLASAAWAGPGLTGAAGVEYSGAWVVVSGVRAGACVPGSHDTVPPRTIVRLKPRCAIRREANSAPARALIHIRSGGTKDGES